MINIKKTFGIVATAAILLAGTVIPAGAATNYSLSPFEYVGAAGDCGTDYPAGTPGGVVAKWDSSTGNPSPSLLLAKNVPTTDCSAAGATVNGVSGITLSELNYDVMGYCGAGAPRFNVVTSDNVTHFFGCVYGTHTDFGNGWTHVVFSPADGIPAVTPGETVQSIELIQDEQGSTNLDNISINDQIIGGPATPSSKDQCKKYGWQNLQDANGQTFRNQGQCVSYFNHQ